MSSRGPTSPDPTHSRGPGWRLRALGVAVSLALTAATLALYAAAPSLPLLDDLEGQSLNLRFRLRGPIAPGREVALVMVDEATVAELGRWPIPRRELARAVSILNADGARVIVFDLLFTAPEAGLSPEVAAGLRSARERLPEGAAESAAVLDRILEAGGGDRGFAAALRAAGNVLIPFTFVFGFDQDTAERPYERLAEAAYAVYQLAPGEEDRLRLQPTGHLAPPAEIAEAAAHMAHVTVALEGDGSLRRDSPVIGYRGDYYPSLPVTAAQAYLGLNASDIVVRFGEGLQIGDRWVPTDGTMRLPVNHYGPTGSFETHSLLDLLENRIAPGLFRDRLVIIGGAAAGVSDSFPSPFTQTLAGSEYVATVIDNILHGRTLVKDARTAGLDMLAILILGLAAAVASQLPRLLTSVLSFAVLLAAAGVGGFVAFTAAGLWLNTVFPVLAIVANFAPLALVRGVREQRARRRAERQRRNLARYFSPAVVDALADRDNPFALDRVQNAAVMFVDIVGFTTLAEQMDPAAAMALLREFHARVERAVFANNGTLDKYLGDGAMACFGVPVPGLSDARNALLCARSLAEDVARWRGGLAGTERPAIKIGVGLHFGPVLMGNAGGERQFQFTVTGDTVNVAARLEALTRSHGAVIVASEALLDAARAAQGTDADTDALEGFVALPAQTVRGREEVMRLWAWRGDGTVSRSPES
ncbi:MAG: adenylate/guanylate cyclase domain-containing protein [Alphaproteobacteria bacterium]|nr:adenylate/guanylate cyclase domain-containing protein [Alphaproteobacteria bacterium]